MRLTTRRAVGITALLLAMGLGTVVAGSGSPLREPVAATATATATATVTVTAQAAAAGSSIVDQVLAAAVDTSTNDLGHREVNLGAGHTFVLVPSGPFPMGSQEGLDDELPVHEVELDDYWIAKFPVTVGQFRAFVEATGYVTDAERGMGSWQWTGEIPGPGEGGDPWRPMDDGGWNNIYFAQGDDHAVGSVSWNDGQAFCVWLSEQLGVPIGLPAEAQWEKAARGSDGRRFPWGNEPPDGTRANYADASFISKYGEHTRRPHPEVDDGYVETSPVGAYPAGRSPYGVYDLAGNLGEWVYDIHADDYYRDSPRRNPSGPPRPPDVPDERIDRVNRGGSWVDWAGVEADGTVAPHGGHSIRAAARTGDEQNSSDDHMGFRVAIDGLRTADVPAPAGQKPDLTGVEIVTHPVAGNVTMLEATGDVAGNIAVSVGPDGILIVDDQWAELTGAITDALGALDASGGWPLHFIINTHHHDDHSDGNASLVRGTDALVVAHERARERLLAKASDHWPVITFNESMSLYFNGEEIRALAMPGGHTDNDVVVFFVESNVVHMGDLFNSGTSSFPTADLSSGGNAVAMLANIDALLPMIPEDAAIISGHGPLSDKRELRRVRKMLDDTITLVRTARQQGRSLEEIIAEGPGADYEDWGYGYMPADGWLEMVYRSLDRGTTFPPPSCDPAGLTRRVGTYGFEGDLDEMFDDHPLWQDHPTPGVINDAVFVQRNGRLEFEVPSASQAASEAWRTWRVQMSSTSSWKISADVVVPAVWTSGEEEDQIGVGLWVGKPGGSTVYEIDFSAHARGSRVVLAQNIFDRHGGDPNYVGDSIPRESASIRMEVMYCHDDRSLSVYYDDGNRVDTQPIDDRGIFDWAIGPVFEVGMIGFAEGPSATSDFPYLDNWEMFEAPSPSR